MALKDPVAVLEHDADLYKITGPAPKQDFDFVLPPGQAAIRRTGSDLTVLTYVDGPKSLEAVDKDPAWTRMSSTCGGSTGPASTGTPSSRASRRRTRW